MELGLSNSLLPGDPRLIDHIVNEVKSQGIFDQFRKECIADVDTKPAYQNLRTRVESSVNSFLNKQTWRTDLNKNQLRETLRKHIHDAPYLEVGVERIVDQVVNPKIYSVFMPQIEDVVYKFMGIERPKSQRHNGPCDLKDLLPIDLDPVSPESDKNSLKDVSLDSIDENVAEVVNGEEEKPGDSNIEEEVEKTEKVEEIEKIEKVETIEKMEKDEDSLPIEKETNEIENGEGEKIDDAVVDSPVKAVLDSSIKSDDANKTEEEEEESPVFEPIEVMNLNESNMSNDSHLSGISELTSHRSRSPDFTTEFSRDNFDYSNQDSQLSKVSSNSRLSIVTDFGLSNHASTPVLDTKEDSKSSKDNFKTGEESENKKNESDVEAVKNVESSKASSSSKESSRDADYKESKSKEEHRSRSSRDKHESRSSRNKDRDRDRDSKRRHSSKSDKYSSSKSKDKNESDSQDSKESSSKYKESKPKETEKKDDTSKEVKDLKDLYKEKIRELQKKKEMTEKEKLNKEKESSKSSKESSRDKNDSSSSKDRDEKKSHKSSSSSSKSSTNHSRSSKSSESKDSREKSSSSSSSSKRDERRYSNGKSDSKSSSRSKRDSRSDSKSESRSRDRSKKRREEKKSKSTDDHSSLRKNSSDRRSTDRDGPNGSSSKYSNKNSYSTNNTSAKLGPSASLTKDKNKDTSEEASDNVYDSLQGNSDGSKNASSYSNSENPPKRVDPGSAEICLPLKKRRLHSDEPIEINAKKIKLDDQKAPKKKIEKDIFKLDADSVPDDERVQIVEFQDEDYDEYTYPSEEPILSIEETKKIILDADPIQPEEPALSEMEKSIRQSLNEMMADHGMIQTEKVDVSPKASTSAMETDTLLEALTDESEPSLLENTDILNAASTEKVNEPVSEEDEERIENMEKYMREESFKLNESLGALSQTEAEAVKEDEPLLESNNKAEIENVEDNIAALEDDITENLEKMEQQVENKINESQSFSKKIIENLDNNDDVSTDNTDEFNEDHKLVIDEEFNEKEIENSSNIEKLVEHKGQLDDNFVDCHINKVIDEGEAVKGNNLISVDEKELNESSENEEADPLKESSEEKSPSDLVILEDSNDGVSEKEELDEQNENTESDEKQTAFTEDPPEEIENRLIDELGKLSENVNDVVEIGKVIAKPVQDDKSSNITNEEKIIVDPTAEYEDEDSKKDHVTSFEEKETEEKDSDINMLESKECGDFIIVKENDNNDYIDDDSFDRDNNLTIVDEKSNESNKTDDSADLEKASVDIAEVVSDIEEEESRPEQDKPTPSTSSEDKEANRTVIVTSPVEEDCIYLECDNKTYLTFKRYLEKFEAEAKRKANDSNRPELKEIEEVEADPSDEEASKGEFDEIEEFDPKDQEEEETNPAEAEEEKDEAKVEPKTKEEIKPVVQVETKVELKKKKDTKVESKKKEETKAEPTKTEEVKAESVKQEVEVKSNEEENIKMESAKEENLEIEPSKEVTKVEVKVKSAKEAKATAPMPAPVAPRPTKRKLSTSPVTEISETTVASCKDDVSKAEQTTSKASTTAKEPIESGPHIPKKRKVGRTKKTSTSSNSSGGSSSAISPQQQPAALVVNGENFVLPLSPESDVSATSDKNLLSTAKEKKGRQRGSQQSSQRYSSDDLYKPRPLFTSSSRRNRRFNPT